MECYGSVCIYLSDHCFDIRLTFWTACILVKLDSFTEEFDCFFKSFFLELNVTFFFYCKKFVVNFFIVHAILKLFTVNLSRFLFWFLFCSFLRFLRCFWGGLGLFFLSFRLYFFRIFRCLLFTLDFIYWFWWLLNFLNWCILSFFVNFSQLRHFKLVPCWIVVGSFILLDEFLASTYAGLSLLVIWLQLTHSHEIIYC